MPGAVANAVVPTVSGHPLVFPFALSKSFTETLSWPVRSIEYHDGTLQRTALVANSRRSWKLAQRLTPAQITTLRSFFLTYKASAFYFYAPKDVAIGQLEGSNYDATGANLQGRYTVRLNGDLDEQIFIPRTEVGIELVEVA